MSITTKYLAHLQVEGKAENTIDTYRCHLVEFLTWLTDQRFQLGELRPANLLDFKEFLLNSGKSERTVNCIISCLRGYYDYLILSEVVNINPVSNQLRIKVPDNRQNRLTDEQLTDFYQFIDALQIHVRAAFYLMLATGARVSEVAELTKESFRLEEGKLLVELHDRLVPVLHLQAAQVLVNYLADLNVTHAPAFRVSKRTLQRYAANFAKTSRISFSCHVLRHTFATLLLEKGVPTEKIQYLLGHRSVTIPRPYTQNALVNVKDLAPSVW